MSIICNKSSRSLSSPREKAYRSRGTATVLRITALLHFGLIPCLHGLNYGFQPHTSRALLSFVLYGIPLIPV